MAAAVCLEVMVVVMGEGSEVVTAAVGSEVVMEVVVCLAGTVVVTEAVVCLAGTAVDLEVMEVDSEVVMAAVDLGVEVMEVEVDSNLLFFIVHNGFVFYDACVSPTVPQCRAFGSCFSLRYDEILARHGSLWA